MFFKKVVKIFHPDTLINLVVDFDCDAKPVASSEAKAPGQNNIILSMMLFQCLFKSFDQIIGAFKVTRTSDTDKNE